MPWAPANATALWMANRMAHLLGLVVKGVHASAAQVQLNGRASSPSSSASTLTSAMPWPRTDGLRPRRLHINPHPGHHASSSQGL